MPRGALRDRARQRRASPARARTSPSSRSARSCRTRCGRRASSRAKASASRCSTRARSSRSTPTRSPRRSRRRTALVVAHEAVQFCGFGSEIAAHVGRALLLGSRRAGRPRRRRRRTRCRTRRTSSWRRCPGRRRSRPPCARWPLAEARASSPVVCRSTAATTTTPPTTVISAGVSPTATHAQNGPRTTSRSVISATSDATISLAPIVKSTSPRPI